MSIQIIKRNTVNNISAIEPKELWQNFEALNAVPRPSKKEERVIQFMKDFGENLGLETMVDHIGNVIIKKPATAGMEDRQTIVMQSHLDMVHQKNADTVFDFDTEGIRMIVDGDWIHADGTTLGADNGIGVATIMAVLASDTIAHPAMEALFTIDEETGMTGALELKGGLLTGTILLNLDTEDDNELTIGCAGGIDITATGTYTEEEMPADHTPYTIKVSGLNGGHSGMDIHKGLGNANKIMNRILHMLDHEVRIRVSSIDGGSVRNAIPRESFATITVPKDKIETMEEYAVNLASVIISEYSYTDNDLEIEISQTIGTPKVMDDHSQINLIHALYACPNGIYRMSPTIEGLVQTSNNLARVIVKDGAYTAMCLCRSSVDTEKMDEVNMIHSIFAMIGAQVELSGTYPGWTPNPQAEIIETMRTIYVDMFNEEPHVNACHAGLECGIIGTNYPDMEMISFGPNIRGAHSPDEKVQISSVQKYWKYLMKVLQEIPKKRS